LGDNFLVTIAKEWEREAVKAKAKAKGAKVIITRFAVVLGANGVFRDYKHPAY
jgi:NAD dependent epimerase/dehydratase family enzyme